MKLGSKTILTTLVLLLLVVVSLVALSVYRQVDMLEREWEVRADILSRDLATAIEVSVAVQDLDDVNRQLAAMASSDADIMQAAVFDARGLRMARYKTAAYGRPDDEGIRRGARMILGGEAIGHVEVILSTTRLRNEARTQMVFGSGVGLLISLLAVVLVWLTHTRLIVRPLERLERATRAIADGGQPDLDASLLERPDELGSLARALAAMARDLRTRERELLQAEKLASIGTLAAGVGHEINNPAAFVLGNVEYVLGVLPELLVGTRAPADLVADVESALEDSRGGIRRISKIAGQLRNFARAADDEGRRLLDVNEIVRSTIAIARPVLKHGIAVDVRLDESLPHTETFEGRVGQVLLNLLVNASDALGGVTDRAPKVVVTTDRVDDFIRVRLRDNGPGIPDDLLKRVFDPFFTTKPAGKGTGLGLAISRDLMVEMGGALRVSSRAGLGTVATVMIPIVGEQPVAKGLHGEPTTPEVPAEGGRLLVIDDEQSLLKAVERLIGSACDVITLAGGGDAILWLQAGHDADVILCDLMMPDVSGIDVFRWLEAHRPALLDGFYFITGGAVTAEAAQVAEQHGDRVLWKPVVRDQLLSLMAQRLRHRGASQAS